MLQPIYISYNMILPISNITIDTIDANMTLTDCVYTDILKFCDYLCQMVYIFVYVFVIIIKETFIAINDNVSLIEKILIVISLYNFISIADNELKNEYKFETTNQQINYLKISEEMWTEEITSRQNEYNTNIQELQTELTLCRQRMDSQKKRLSDQKTKEQLMIKNITDLNKEVKKVKKELTKYD